TTWRPSVSSTPCTLATPIRWNTTDFIRDPTLRRQYSSRRRLTLAGSLVPKSANSRSFDSGVEILQHRGKCLEGCFPHGLDDELHVPDPFARIGTQLIGDNLRTSPKRCCHRRCFVRVLPTGPTRHFDKDGDRALDLARLAAGSDTGIVDSRTQRSDAIGPVSGLSIPGIPGSHIRNGDLEHPLARRPDEQRRAARTRPGEQLAVARGI